MWILGATYRLRHFVVSFHEALDTSASRSDRHSMTELRVICAIGECWPKARSHSESSEPAIKVRNSGVKVGSHEWSKSETSKLTNFETALSLLPSVRKEARGCSETSRMSLLKWTRSRTAVCKLHICLTFRRLAWAAHCLQALLSLLAPTFDKERFHKAWKAALCIVTAADSLALSMDGL